MKYLETKHWINSAGKSVSEGILTMGELEVRVISGGGGKGALPAGKYIVKRASLLGPNTPNYEAYKRDGIAFFAPIIPQFNTDRTLLGIHPDGNKLGTLGCIGIQEKFNQAWEYLSVLPKDGEILTVKMKG